MKTLAIFAVLGAVVVVAGPSAAGAWAGGQSAAGGEARTATPPAIRGKKLVLKDGSFQLVRSYERQGEKVRYLSAERGDWEELPSAMVDWEATAKAAAADDAAATSLVEHIHQQQVESAADVPKDVDASLRVGAGVFLPDGEGMFAVEGKTVTRLEQTGANTKLDKKRAIEQVISPVPVVPSKRNVVLAGEKAKIRIVPGRDPVEFFLRELPIDPETGSAIVRSANPGDSAPEVELVRATVKGGKRQLESIRALFGEKLGTDRQIVSLQRWDVAPTVFRFTLSETLAPGEYALAEILPDGINMFVWDFGVDAGSTEVRKRR